MQNKKPYKNLLNHHEPVNHLGPKAVFFLGRFCWKLQRGKENMEFHFLFFFSVEINNRVWIFSCLFQTLRDFRTNDNDNDKFQHVEIFYPSLTKKLCEQWITTV